MRKSLSITMLLAIAAICLGLSTQAYAQRKPSAVLGLIPADAAGYVLVNDLSAAMQNADGLIKELGLGEQVPPNLLGMIQAQMQLGDGFAPADGLAIAVLNFKKFNFDPLVAMNLKPANGNAQPGLPIPPMAIYVPGKSIATTFPKANIQQTDNGTMLMGIVPMPLFAIEQNGFVVLAMNPKILDSIKAVTIDKSTAAKIGKKLATIIASSDIYINLNWEVLGPLYNEMLDLSMKQMDNPHGMPKEAAFLKPLVETYAKLGKKVMNELTTISFAVRITKTDIIIEEFIEHKSDGVLASAAPANSVTASELLKGLPSEQYVLACSQLAPANASGEILKIYNQLLDTINQDDLPFKLPVNTIGRMKKLVKTASGQITSVKFVGGGSADAAFATALIINCKDADTIKSMLADKTTLIHEIIQAAGADEEEVKGLKIEYRKGTETIAGISVDTVDITHPEMNEMADKDKKIMQAVLGSKKVRLLVASPDNKTVIVTFGGDITTLANVLKTRNSPLLDAPGVKEALAKLPRDLSALALVSPNNLMDTIKNAMIRTDDADEAKDIPTLSSKAPVVIGAICTKTSTHAIILVPIELIKNIVELVKDQENEFYEDDDDDCCGDCDDLGDEDDE